MKLESLLPASSSSKPHYLCLRLSTRFWVGEIPIDNFEEGCEAMLHRCTRTDDVEDLPTPNRERVGDERTMATPGNGFSAHDGRACCACNLNEDVEAFGELRRDHVVGVSAEGCVSPSGVDGIFAAMAAASEGFDVRVSDACGVEQSGERVGVELWNMARLGNGPHVDEVTNSARCEESNELFERASGVADGEEDGLRHCSIVMRGE